MSASVTETANAELKRLQDELQQTRLAYQQTQEALLKTQSHYEAVLSETQEALRHTQSLFFEAQANIQRLKIAFLNSAEIAPNLPRKQMPSIFINAVPKTGGLYIYRTLEAGLKYTSFETCLNIFPGAVLDHRRISLFTVGNCICHHHLDASDVNLWHIERNKLPMMFHTRDLRSVMLSWTHHLTAAGNPAAMGGHALIAPAQEFFDRPLDWRIDWTIDTQLPVYVNFMRDWLQAIDTGRVKALVTRYEDFMSDRQAFFDKILRFFEIGDGRFPDPQLKPSQSLNLRSGKPDEWRTVMTKSQIGKINAGIPSEWWERFAWTA